MKNIFKSLCLLSLFVSLTNCDSDDNDVKFGNADFVQIADSSPVVITENSGSDVEIELQLASPRNEDVSVTLSGNGNSSRYVISPSGGTVTIPAGETSATVVFSAIDNDDIDGDIDVVLNLTSSSGIPVGIGGQGANGASKTVTIVDDNVPCNAYTITFTTDRWGSEDLWDIVDSNGVTVATGGPYSDLASGTATYITNVTLEDGCYTFRAFDFYGDGMTSDAGSGFSVICGSLNQGSGGGTFPGIPGLDLSTVPVNSNYGAAFWPGSPTDNVDPYVGHAVQAEFCVNQ